MLANTPQRAINKHHHRVRTLGQMSSAECCGDTNIRLYQPYLIETVGQTPNRVLHIGEYSNRDMSPRSSIRADTNTVTDATKINNPKVNSTIEYNHACMRSP